MLNHRISRKNIYPLEDDDSARPCWFTVWPIFEIFWEFCQNLNIQDIASQILTPTNPQRFFIFITIRQLILSRPWHVTLPWEV